MQVDPKLMDDHLGIDRKKKPKAPKQPKEEHEFKPVTPEELDAVYDGAQDVWGEEESEYGVREEEPREYDNPKHAQEEELLPGLYSSDLDSWKRQFDEVLLVRIKGEPFIIRTLERFEYKQIISAPNTDPLIREEMICEHCVLYPQGYNFSVMANQKAGLPALLSEMIMEHSGFTKDVTVEKL